MLRSATKYTDIPLDELILVNGEAFMQRTGTGWSKIIFRTNCSSCTTRRKKCDGNRRCSRCLLTKDECVYAIDKVRSKRKVNASETTDLQLPAWEEDVKEDVSKVEVETLDVTSGEDLCLFTLSELVPHQAPGLTLLPWDGLALESPYGEVYRHFLVRITEVLPNIQMVQALSPRTLAFWPALYKFIEGKVYSHVPVTAADLRTELLLLILSGMVLTRQAELPTSTKRYPNFARRLFRLINLYLGQLKTPSDWKEADVLFHNRTKQLWTNLEHLFLALMVKPGPIQPLPPGPHKVKQMAQSLQFVWNASFGDVPAGVDLIAPAWLALRPVIFTIFYGYMLGMDMMSYIMNWRIIHENADANVPWSMLGTGCSLSLQNPNFKDLYDACIEWYNQFPIDPTTIGVQVINDVCVIQEDFDFSNNGLTQDGFTPEMYNFLQWETSWKGITHINNTMGRLLQFQSFMFWLTYPDLGMWDTYLFPIQGADAGQAVEILSRGLRNLFSLINLIARLYACHIAGMLARQRDPKQYFEQTSLQSFLQYPYSRTVSFVIFNLLVELLEQMMELSQVKFSWKISGEGHEVKVDLLEHGPDGVKEYKDDLTDYCTNINETAMEELVLFVSYFMGFGSYKVPDHQQGMRKLMTTVLPLLSILLRAQNVELELGYLRVKSSLAWCKDKLSGNHPTRLGILGLARVYADFPVE